MTTEELRRILLRVASALKRTHNFDVKIKNIIYRGDGDFKVDISVNGRATGMCFWSGNFAGKDGADRLPLGDSLMKPEYRDMFSDEDYLVLRIAAWWYQYFTDND